MYTHPDLNSIVITEFSNLCKSFAYLLFCFFLFNAVRKCIWEYPYSGRPDIFCQFYVFLSAIYVFLKFCRIRRMKLKSACKANRFKCRVHKTFFDL